MAADRIRNNDATPRISVYVANAGELSRDALFRKVHDAVSERRKEKTDRYRFRKDQNLSLCAEYLLMCACRDFGVEYERETIVTTGHGKPYFADAQVAFSLSHSGERAMCVMADCEVGCDVEKISGAHMGVARRFFSAPEFSALEKCETDREREELFCRIWTVKESFIKCTGAGLSLPLNSFSVVDDGGMKQMMHENGVEYAFFEKELEDDYCCALCLKLSGGERQAAMLEESICIHKMNIAREQE